ncbi:hypothetical protein O3P69_000635 [Scylla paramamosain]|uniref:Uncharacterized protein n=1 Tax=Scylla paramamosain TaxID=85552 RepID=A0AAW0UT01_SCYPA
MVVVVVVVMVQREEGRRKWLMRGDGEGCDVQCEKKKQEGKRGCPNSGLLHGGNGKFSVDFVTACRTSHAVTKPQGIVKAPQLQRSSASMVVLRDQ